MKLFPPGFEPGTFRVLGERDSHYTTETARPLLPGDIQELPASTYLIVKFSKEADSGNTGNSSSQDLPVLKGPDVGFVASPPLPERGP